jgi:hypothetical protein
MNVTHLLSAACLALSVGSVAQGREGEAGYLREYGIDLRPVPSTNLRVAGSGTHGPGSATAARDADYLRKYGIDLRPVRSQALREEVLAELQLWREAGLDLLERGEAGADTHSLQYRRALARYAQLRASPRFDELVEEIARARGKPVIVVAQ